MVAGKEAIRLSLAVSPELNERLGKPDAACAPAPQASAPTSSP